MGLFKDDKPREHQKIAVLRKNHGAAWWPNKIGIISPKLTYVPGKNMLEVSSYHTKLFL